MPWKLLITLRIGNVKHSQTVWMGERRGGLGMKMVSIADCTSEIPAPGSSPNEPPSSASGGCAGGARDAGGARRPVRSRRAMEALPLREERLLDGERDAAQSVRDGSGMMYVPDMSTQRRR